MHAIVPPELGKIVPILITTCKSIEKTHDNTRIVGECVSTIRPRDTFDGSAHGTSPCEDDISKGLVDG